MSVRLLPEMIASERVVLRRHSPEHAERMFAQIDGDRARLREYLPWVDKTLTVEDTRQYIARSMDAWKAGSVFDFGMYRLEGGDFLGNIGVHSIRWDDRVCELGYWIAGKFEGQAFVSESIMALEKAVFDLGFHRVEIRCDPKNVRSARIPERLEYLLEGRLREDGVVNGIRRDTRIYARLRTEAGYPALPET